MLAINSIIITEDKMKHYIDIEAKKFDAGLTVIEKVVIGVCLVIGFVLLTLYTPFAWLAGKIIRS